MKQGSTESTESEDIGPPSWVLSSVRFRLLDDGLVDIKQQVSRIFLAYLTSLILIHFQSN